MTRFQNAQPPAKPKPPRSPPIRQPGRSLLQDARARFSELVRLARSEGPQHVTIHGRDEVVVISVKELHRLKGNLTGKALIAALQASPDRDIDLEPAHGPLPVRGVTL